MNSDTKFRINLKEGLFELEGNESFVNKHLEKFEEIFKLALKEAILTNKDNIIGMSDTTNKNPVLIQSFSSGENNGLFNGNKNSGTRISDNELIQTPFPSTSRVSKHSVQKVSINIPPLPVDLKANQDKMGLREFYKEKNPTNHYEKTTLFVYYISKFNKQQEIKYGEILSCYEEINEKKPSIVDIVKNSIRYKGWLEPGIEKYSTRITISGENFIKFDLPKMK